MHSLARALHELPELSGRTMSMMSMSILVAGLAAGMAAQGAGAPPEPPGPGDDKQGYETPDYVTRSRKLSADTLPVVDLYEHALRPQLGLPPPSSPPANPLTEAGIALGRKLFFDRRLSPNNTMSCAMCHVPEHGFAHREMKTAVGIEGRSGRRNAPTIYNVAYLERLFHDGREFSLETQVWSPLLAANEMGNRSVGMVIGRIESLPDYAGLFETVFGSGPGMETIGKALASYQRVLVAADSAFDQWRYGSRPDALSDAARRGHELFTGRAGCAGCHLIGERYALLTDQKFHNTGIGYRAMLNARPARRQIALAPGQTVAADTFELEAIGGQPFSDLGRYEITGRPEDRWRYRTPSLRNVALTGPYMHDGSIATLQEVVSFYAAGGVANEDLDPMIRPLSLDARDRADLVAFLESLTSAHVTRLVADARAAPIGGG